MARQKIAVNWALNELSVVDAGGTGTLRAHFRGIGVPPGV